MMTVEELKGQLLEIFPRIWRCADSYKWNILYPTNLLTFDWINVDIDYQTIDFATLKNGRRAIEPWVKQLKKGDLIFVMGKNSFHGIAIAMSEYSFVGDKIDMGSNGIKPAIKVNYLFKIENPIPHLLATHNNPTTFAFIHQYNFGLKEVLQAIETRAPLAYECLLNYVENKKHQKEFMPIINLLEYKKQIILQGPPGTGKTREAELIACQMLGLSSVNDLKNCEEFKLIQFHPSYTYEDFARGIVAKPNEDGDGIIYEAQNKLFGKFAQEALVNYMSSQKQEKMGIRDDDFELFKSHVLERIDEDGKFEISDKVYILYVDDKRFKYKGDNWTAHPNGLNMNFDQIQKIIDLDLNTRQEINKCTQLNPLTRQHATYFQNFVELYRQFTEKNPVTKSNVTLKPYILIIDEINRANLSSVLGELIYALEYRGNEVDSMYEVDGSNKITLPPNLYIIGTMNTADRSVGHIDYAIRRRFSFVDVLPKDLSGESGIVFYDDLFYAVSELFIKNYADYRTDKVLERAESLSPEFRPEDVWLGHSYFIEKEGAGKEIRYRYEILPILKEYFKDGVLIGDEKFIFDKLEQILTN